MAIGAAKYPANDGNICLIELSHFVIHNIVMFDQNSTGTQVHIELAQIEMKSNSVTASFTYSAALGGESADLMLTANGELKPRPNRRIVRQLVLEDRVEPFRSLVKLERKLGRAACVANKTRSSTPPADALLVHPVDLHAVFRRPGQSLECTTKISCLYSAVLQRSTYGDSGKLFLKATPEYPRVRSVIALITLDTLQHTKLTGNRGLLRHHLLNALVAQPLIRMVICVAARQLPKRLRTKQLPSPSDRVAAISSEVDTVIHNTLDIGYLKYDSTLQQTNVKPTRQLLRVCLQCKMPIHYVPSVVVAPSAELEAFPAISCTKTGKLLPADGTYGHMCRNDFWYCTRDNPYSLNKIRAGTITEKSNDEGYL
ncbi:hypothetical protein CIB48_g330 [Xylaria polymorpha]|nr:hypothetical protein CIB48_g330 [Xylaria polymorpha]